MKSSKNLTGVGIRRLLISHELIFMRLLFLMLTLMVITSGCQHLESRQQEARMVQPVLPDSIGRDELVDHLNQVNAGLKSWRCMDTVVHVSKPGLPLPRLTGRFACESPSRFRLVSDNFASSADFGANDDICWAYVKPGESVVLTWKHEDSHLLTQLPGDLPRLEPEWLMAVLGIQPLNPERYELQNSPLGSKELWLVSVEDAPDGSSLRRVIKVDPLSGLVREHALYNSNREHLLRAQLSDYRQCGGYRLPHHVRIEFPQHQTQLALTFRSIQTDCAIEPALWQVPEGRNLEVVDLGELVRARAMIPNSAAPRQSPDHRQDPDPGDQTTVFHQPKPTAMDGQGFSETDDSGNGSKSGNRQISYQQPGDAEPTDEFPYDPEFDGGGGSAVPQFDIVTPSQAKKRSFWPWKR
jgi:hypothetical protein